MKKIILVTLVMFLMISTVSSISIGQNITQEQLDLMDVSTVDLQPSLNIFELIRNTVYRAYTYLTLKRYRGEDKYEIVEKIGKVRTFPLNDYKICKTLYTQQECVNYYKIKSNIEMTKRHDILRNNLAKFQTQAQDPDVLELK